MDPDKLKSLEIGRAEKSRSSRPLWIIFLSVIVITTGAIIFAVPRASDQSRVKILGVRPPTNSFPAAAAATSKNPAAAPEGQFVLTVSGYIVTRERIELSPRFLGVVKWIGVKKGDSVTNGQVVVLLDDAEYRARLVEAEGRKANSQANLERAGLDFERIKLLSATDIESRKARDDARLAVESAKAQLQETTGGYELVKTYLDWTVIRSPINGVVLEKLVDPYELVVPQSFGGTRGPSTALIALADLKDLQVEIDVNEGDLSKIHSGQKCKVTPEAFPDKSYPGVVAEIAPEAVRSKGTLQIKVQILNPDRFLTPELSARVDFLKE
jgi:HlyD family secretion protein